MITKYGIDENVAGFFAGLPALGALFLTPVFGGMVDKRGKAASIMMFGAAMLIFVHFVYALPFVTGSYIAIILMIILGIAFSLVPSAMWPSVAKIFPAHQLGTAYALIFFIQNIGLWGAWNSIRPHILYPEHRSLGCANPYRFRSRQLLYHRQDFCRH